MGVRFGGLGGRNWRLHTGDSMGEREEEEKEEKEEEEEEEERELEK